MSRSLTRISLALVLFMSSEVWAIGLGDIDLDSALNEPLRAEIDLLSATPEELSSLTVSLASAETFARYGIDRPFYLQELQFNVTTGPGGPVVQVRSRSPITEPFLTFLVEAEWSAGRLLREYTVLLDPPTYAPPAVQETPAVQAPRRATPTDSGRIEREPPAPQPEPEPQPQPTVTAPTRSEPAPTPSAEPAPSAEPTPSVEPAPSAEPTRSYTPDSGYSTTSGGDVYVNRGDTLWGITQRMRPDSRLTVNQTMLAIYEANREAFSGNINRLKAGATLRIPSANEVFQISRGEAFAEVKRQNDSWRADKGIPDTSVADTSYDEPTGDTGYDAGYDETPAYEEPADAADATADTAYDAGYGVEEPPAEPETETSLTLVPPDEEATGSEYTDELGATEPLTREQEIESRIAELEAADVPEQQSLIEIRDNELAALRQELAEIRGETAALDDIVAEDASPEDVAADEEAQADVDTEAAAEAEPTPVPTNIVRTPRASEPGLMDRVMDILGSTWLKIIAGAVLLAGVALWFLRRSRGDDDEQPWETLDSDEFAAGTMSSTETLQAPRPDESFVVEEQDSGVHPMEDDTVEAPMPDESADTGATGQFDSLEDTFSSETAVNLDQTDPLAEADFHMAYGLYDQAADLINGALESDPNDQALMSKLCEIYFVWGNRDAFIDAATRLKAAVGDGESPEWDKIVIMGQQIAGDDALFAGAGVGATKAVDLSFESDMDDAAELDMDFGGDDGGGSDILDLGADDAAETAAGDGGLDFAFDDDVTEETPDDDSDTTELTAEMPAATEPTVETPTIEEQFSGLEGTSELPSLDDSLDAAISDSGQDAAETAEINLDELDLDVDGMDETELASLDDLDATGTNEALPENLAEITGKNPEIDPDATGVQESLDPGESDVGGEFDLDDIEDDLGATGLRLAPDETGRMPTMDAADESDLLDATGHTQILSDDMAVDTATDVADLKDDDATMLAPASDDEDETPIGGDAETLLAPMDDDEDDFDFAKTEALPPDAFTSNVNLDETSEMPGVAQTDVDLDLDDLTAALQVSEVGDTVEQPRDDATVEQPRPSMDDETAEVPTMSLSPDDMSDDLHEARTMTEVGTKLDLARAYVDMGDPQGARSILEEVLDEGDEGQRQQAQQLLDSLPG